MRWALGMRVAAGSAVLAAVVAAVGPMAAAEDPALPPTPTVTGTSSTASTATPTPTGTGRPSATPAPSRPNDPPRTISPGEGEGEPDHPVGLSGALLAAQIAEADRISAALSSSNSAVAAATREMDVLSDRSNALLESLLAARETERAATDEAARAHADLVVLEGRLATARQILREWVFSVYSGGGGDSDLFGMLDALTAEPEDVGDPLGDLSYLTEQRTRALQDVKVLTAEQVRLSATADAAEASSAAATAVIERDKAELDKAVLTQRAKVGQLRRLQVAEVERAGPVASILVGARTEAARAAAQRLRDALTAASVDIAAIGKPCTNDLAFHPNGMIPPSGLCPVWGAAGERLSPAAAASFNALSKAYAAQTGVPLCITDSYRSLPDQISVKATRGRFAATPGTSRHGLGRAVDLCGGVQDFGSPAHRWMRQNAPLYGWFHPSWAAAGGSLPEPWHWEFAG
ncbi:MAG TPA: M15 family metallopeptidase [Ornithinibacter sp.]|nr:M15 family metallopeptidase [Ornithinibacter sp.]